MSTEIGSVGSSVARDLLRAHRGSACVTSGRSSGRDQSSLATEWVITDGWLRAAITVRRTVSQARSPLHRLAQDVGAAVALPDRRLVPDQDARAVEARQQALVEQVVRARDVGAELLQVRHDAVHVGAR